ncbi:hypothetical protein BDW22DRAFT_1335278, partial [Trametopsis cervina]
FLWIAGVLVQGVGLTTNARTCAAGVHASVILYGFSKVFIYVFLAEKVHVVWAPSTGRPRHASPVYLTCMALVAIYIVIISNLLVMSRSGLNNKAQCIVGMQTAGTYMLLGVDIFISVTLTSLFIWPLWRHNFRSPLLRRVTARSMTATLITLPTSCVNMGVLAWHHSEELGWAFVISWEADVRAFTSL